MKKKTILLTIAMFVISGVVIADDLFSPDWRGDARTVTAEWDSWGNFSTVAPTPADTWSKGAGTIALVPPTPEAAFDPTLAQVLSSYEGRDDVLQVDDFSVGFALPNFYDGDHKTIRVQVTYWADDGNIMFPVFFVFAGLDPYNMEQLLPGYPMPVFGDPVGFDDHNGSGWLTEAFDFTIAPNPAWEVFYVDFAIDNIYLDQVVVDTICVPEPATICLLGLGRLALRKRKQ